MNRDGFAALEPPGGLPHDDFTRAGSVIAPHPEKTNRLNGLFIHPQTFRDWESFAPLVSHRRRVRQHHQAEALIGIAHSDRTAVFFDTRHPTRPAREACPEPNTSQRIDIHPMSDNAPLPNNEFNTRIVLFGREAAPARVPADTLRREPWHNATYHPVPFETLRAAIA